MTLEVPSTSPHYLSAERVVRALKKTIPILINRGVLLPPSQSAKSPTPNSPSPVKPLPKQSRDIRPNEAYRAQTQEPEAALKAEGYAFKLAPVALP